MKKIVCSILLFLVCAANAQSGVIGPRLKFIQKNRQSGRNRLFKTISEGIIPVTMKFSIEIDMNALKHELPDGIDIYTISGTPLYSKHVLVAQMDP
ncbi:MAG: hypothetical protein V2J62_07010, partial [candidate division KSB1 bacterium]|nr:hypothetical protein [candidate division KSB1 bacterium]